tara:strand:- start:1429 stop:1755 length:327 start_codon:yes stop_codon:yes gene_type:complete
MNNNVCDEFQDLREPSICIPRIQVKFSKEKIKQIFESLKIGEVAQVDLIKNNKDRHNYRAFIHFKKWNEEFNDVRNKLFNGDNIKIVHDFPWFWKCFKSKFPRPEYLH